MSWDDGKHTKVKRVQLTFDDVIKSIEVEYDGSSLKSQTRGTVGTKSDGFTLSPDEYITEVNGYYKTVFSGDVITALTFKTNKKTYGTYGNKTSNYFSLNAPTNNQITGFLGSSGNALNSIDAHFGPLPPPVSTGTNPGIGGTGESNAGNPGTNTGIGGSGTNPGGNNSGGSNAGNPGTNTGIGGSGTNPGGNNSGGSNAGNPGTNTGIGGSGTNPGGNNSGGSNAGNPGTNSGTGGAGTNPGGNNSGGSNAGNPGTNTGIGGSGTNPGGNNSGGSNAGNPGTGGSGTNPGGNNSGGSNAGNPETNLGISGDGTNPEGNSSGTNNNGSNTDSSLQKVEAQGGKGGNQWDDGADHDGVTKIYVTPGDGIEQIRFDYVKNGQPKEGPFHGVKGNRSFIYTVEINHPDEYLLSVKGCYDSSNNIQGIEFKTNIKTSEYFGYDDGSQFSLEVKDKKIIGFHGFADTHLNSLGAYFVPISTSSSSVTPTPPSSTTPPSSSTPPPTLNKSEAKGGNGGETFDDGVFDHVTKVYVGQGDSGVSYVKFDYEKGGNKETREHGIASPLGAEYFEVDSGDYITSMEVYVDKITGYKSDIITAIAFKTFKGKTSHPFGMTTETKYELKDGNGGKLVGFHGKASDVLYAIGAYFAPVSTSSSSLAPLPPSTPPSPTLNKSEAKGGNGGETFDDGVFDHVTKVYVGQGDSGVSYIKFDYEKGGEKETREHGTESPLGAEYFEVDSGDYITSMEVYVDKITGYKSEIITSIAFKTFKGKTSQPFGMTTETKYELKDGKGGKLVGFHGNASDVLYAIGAYFAPATN